MVTLVQIFAASMLSAAYQALITLDTIVHFEIPAWQASATSFLPILLLDWLIMPTRFHYMYIHHVLCPENQQPFQDYQKRFKGTIEAYHHAKCVFSCYQLSSYFAHFIGAGLHSIIMAGIGTKCWYSVVDEYKPSYTYFTKRLKKPSDKGFLTGCSVLFFMMGMNLILFLRGIFLIVLYVRRRRAATRSTLINAPLCYIACEFCFAIHKKLCKAREKCISFCSKRKQAKENSSYCLTTFALPSILKQAFTADSNDTSISFDSDSTTIVLDNSATYHICNDKSMFIGNIINLPADSQIGVETAGGTAKSVGHGSIRITFHDNNGILHSQTIDDVLYFPSSPVNILGITKLGEQRGDPEGTHILTKAKYSVFTWDHGKSKRDIHHQSSGLPELPINEGMSVFSSFYLAFCSMVPILDVTKRCLMSRLEGNPRKSNNATFATRCCLRSSFQRGDAVNIIAPGST
jgi:hypothetical protein